MNDRTMKCTIIEMVLRLCRPYSPVSRPPKQTIFEIHSPAASSVGNYTGTCVINEFTVFKYSILYNANFSFDIQSSARRRLHFTTTSKTEFTVVHFQSRSPYP